MATEDEELMAAGPGEEDSGESSNRTFLMLALGLGGLFIVGVICIVAIFFYQQSQRNAQIASATAMVAKTATAVAEVTAQAMAALVTTEAPPTVAPASGPTVTPTLTNTPMPVAAITATPIPTVTAAVTKPAPGATSGPTTAVATATLAAGKTPETGVGGLGMALAAAALLVVLFAARRLRLAQH